MTKQNQPQSQGQDSKNTGQSGDAAQRGGAPNAPNRGNDPKNVQQTSKDQRDSGKGREGVDAPRTEQGNQGGKNEQRNQGGQKEQGAKTSPRYDDRPSQQRGGSDDKQTPGAALPKSGTPNYGDQEPGDPRRLDVDAGTGGRSTSTERKNPS